MLRKMWKQKLALALVLVIIIMCASPAFAVIPSDALDELTKGGKQSTDLITHSIIDLVYVSNGSVTTYTYKGAAEELTINKFTVAPQSPTSASQKITPFVFELTNQYRPETDIAVTSAGPDSTVHTYTYGTYKDNAMLAIISGLPDCLGNPPVHQDSNSRSWTSKYSPEEMTKEPVTSFLVTTFALYDSTYTVTSSESDSVEARTMDVEPDLVNGRIFAPVRYVAYAVGVHPDDVGWDQATRTVTLAKDDTTVQLTLESNILGVNDKATTMDTVPYIKQGRTMLPPRWVAEAFGAQVDWDAENRQAIITVEQLDPGSDQ